MAYYCLLVFSSWSLLVPAVSLSVIITFLIIAVDRPPMDLFFSP